MKNSTLTKNYLNIHDVRYVSYCEQSPEGNEYPH